MKEWFLIFGALGVVLLQLTLGLAAIALPILAVIWLVRHI